MSIIKMTSTKESKQDAIELKETTTFNHIQLTKEENRKILPKEVKNLQYILSNYSNITKYTWEKDGIKIFEKDEYFFTREEKKILKYLLLQEIPSKYRPTVRRFIFINYITDINIFI
jgi:hypothetical protein